MHGLSPDDELAYWREQAKHWQAKHEQVQAHAFTRCTSCAERQRHNADVEASLCPGCGINKAVIADLTDRLATAQHALSNERQVVADLRKRSDALDAEMRVYRALIRTKTVEQIFDEARAACVSAAKLADESSRRADALNAVIEEYDAARRALADGAKP
jgi:hypothetical protein